MADTSINIEPFSDRVRKLWELMNPCVMCPRQCKVNRSEGETGFCGTGDLPVVSAVNPHYGEESVLVGRGGSGTIFFAGCNLGCIFCQNYDISHLRRGTKVSIEQLADSMLNLQRRGCSNINLVTPTHLVPAIAAALELAGRHGLKLPVVYNTGGYDSVDTLKLLEGLIDIYMPDMKYSDTGAAKQLSSAPDYPRKNKSAVKEMHRQVGDLQIEKGLATRGLMVRHLVLPNNMAGSAEIIDFLADNISSNTAINVMDQYRPCYMAQSNSRINRRPTPGEFEKARAYAENKGLRIIY